MPGAYVAPGVSPDVLAQLLGASWRGIGFPALMFDTKGGHNLVVHKRVDRDGWFLEDTGQNGNVHTFKAPFINTIVPGQNETWGAEPLYPNVYRRMLAALEDRTDGTFVDPDLGPRLCKVSEWQRTIDPDFRGGPTLVVTLFETVGTGTATPLASTSTLSIAVDAAQSLDAEFLPLVPPPDTGTPGGISLTDFLKSLGALADEWSLMKMQWAAAIDRVSYQMGILAEKFGDEPGFSDKTNRLIAALHAIKQRGLRQAKPVGVYHVAQRCTVAQIAGRTGNSVSDLFKLNPQLAASPIVQPGVAVVVYQ